MANITQKINSFVHGISLQPDHLKTPGQVRDLVNGLPDVMAGLVKRPGSEIVSSLKTSADGRWFTILRDDDEKYVGKADTDGIYIKHIQTKDDRVVKYSSTPDIDNPNYTTFNDLPYFQNLDPSKLEFLTINDYTIVLNRAVPTAMGGATVDSRPNEAFITLNSLEYNAEYIVSLTAPDAVPVDEWKAAAISVNPSPRWTIRDDNSYTYSGTQTYTIDQGSKTGLRFTITANPRWSGVPGYYDETTYDITYTLHSGGRGWRVGDVVTVDLNGKQYTITVTKEVKTTGYNSIADAYYLTPQNSSNGNVSMRDLLTDVKGQLEITPGIQCEVVGSGLYITYTKPFSIYATGGQGAAALTGFTDAINDISDLPSQCVDGYVVRVVNSAADEDDYYMEFHGKTEGVSGAGVWEECVKPGITISLDYNTMPHQLVRMSDSTFLLSPIDWENRLVGDEKTNPEPSFIGKTINRALFYRNRLTFLSDENIVQSQSGDYFNFFVNTAMIVSDNDPIDIAATSTSPCELHDAVPMKIGLILFSRDRQFLYGTTNDVLSPKTAKIETISTYDWNEHIRVVDMGVTLGFLSSSGKYSRFFELTNLETNNAPEALEQSKIVSTMLPFDLDMPEPAQSKENTLLGFAKRGESIVYFYRYFNDGSKRLMSSWFKWEFRGKLQYHFIDKDIYYTVVEHAGNVFLTKSNLTIKSDDYFYDVEKLDYAPRLDLRSSVKKVNTVYYPHLDRTFFAVAYQWDPDVHVFVSGTGHNQGRSAKPVSMDYNAGLGVTEFGVDGDWSESDISVGYEFEFKVELPTLYMSKESADNKQRSDTRSYLTIHRVKFQFADIGIFETHVTARSKADRDLLWEMTPGDHYKANRHAIQPIAFQTIPCYEKNLNLNFTLTSSHPTPAALLSMEWEGKISPKSYRSV